MSIHLCTRKKPISSLFPQKLRKLLFRDLRHRHSYNKEFIQGTLTSRRSLSSSVTGSLLKFVLQDETEQKLSVFLLGEIAEKSDLVLKKGDTVVLAGFKVEASPTAAQHSWHVLLDSDTDEQNPELWIQSAANTAGHPSTSSSSAESLPTHQLESTSAVAADSFQKAQSALSSKHSSIVAVPVHSAAKSRTYTYSCLNSLKSDFVVSVYGVVKFHKLPTKTRGTDYFTVLSIVDPSLFENGRKLKCVVFAKTECALPQVTVGSIVRFHRLRIGTHDGELQGRDGVGFCWLVFDGQQGGSMIPKASVANYTFTDDDRQKVTELRQWAYQQQLSNKENTCSLENISSGIYFDFVCQVVATCIIEEGVSVLLRVWDGTQPIIPVRVIDTDGDECNVIADQQLMRRAKDFIRDVCLFDDHFNKGKEIQPGMFIKLCNLHAAVFKNQETGEEHAVVPTVELVLHHGTSYRRGVVVLAEDSCEVVSLKNRLSKIQPNSDLSPDVSERQLIEPPGGDRENSRNDVESTKEVDSSSAEKRRKLMNDCVSVQLSCDLMSGSGRLSDEFSCMVTTATVTDGHHHIEFFKIIDIRNHEAPYKFRLQAHVVDYQPKAESVESFLKLYCSSCHYLSALPNSSDYGSSNCKDGKKPILGLPVAEDNGVKYYNCPQCLQQASQNDEDSILLQYIYMMKFLLNDGFGMLTANLWKEHAVKFFNDIQPEDILREREKFTRIQNGLQEICPAEKELSEKPWLECCIMSYTGNSTIYYQLFDTIIA